jgi:hypothetical protein
MVYRENFRLTTNGSEFGIDEWYEPNWFLALFGSKPRWKTVYHVDIEVGPTFPMRFSTRQAAQDWVDRKLENLVPFVPVSDE